MINEIIPLLKPIINKVGDGAFSKIGEEIWELIKKPFEAKQNGLRDLNEEKIKVILEEILNENPTLKNDIKSRLYTKTNVIKNINNTGATIEKQINIGNVNGTINL